MKPHKDNPIIREQSATYDDYASLKDDGRRYELADGTLELMTPAPSPKHQYISNQLQHLITDSCQSDYLIFASPIDLILSQTEVRQPDLVMVHRNRKSIVTRRGIEGTPDLVAEIVSPHSVKRDRYSKKAAYSRYRIPEYWIVDPSNESLEQYVLDEGDKYTLREIYESEETIRSDRLSCISFTMKQITESAADLPG
ncbi:Uma2 family endonuclease [Paenibacillus tarimensis]